MGVRFRPILALLNTLGGLLGAYSLRESAMPLRQGGADLDLGAFPVAALPLILMAGVVIGYAQEFIGRRGKFGWAAAVGFVLGLVVHLVVSLMVQITRYTPVPGDGNSLDPSAAELNGGLVYWGTFVTGAVSGLFLTRVWRSQSSVTERAVATETN